MIPVLLNHNPSEVIGRLEQQGDRLIVEFQPGTRITKEMFFTAFGAGARFIDSEFEGDVQIIRKAEILEFSCRA